MVSSRRGLYLVGDKAANRITGVQVADPVDNSIQFRLHEYVGGGIEPDYKTLPWQQDIESKPA
jgi:hypothetical protein